MPLTGEREISPEGWVRDQTEKILATGTTEGVQVFDRPIVLVTIRGAKSGKLRYTPLMRVEHDGEYAVVASLGGAPQYPVSTYVSTTEFTQIGEPSYTAFMTSRVTACWIPAAARVGQNNDTAIRVFATSVVETRTRGSGPVISTPVRRRIVLL